MIRVVSGTRGGSCEPYHLHPGLRLHRAGPAGGAPCDDSSGTGEGGETGPGSGVGAEKGEGGEVSAEAEHAHLLLAKKALQLKRAQLERMEELLEVLWARNAAGEVVGEAFQDLLNAWWGTLE